MAEYQDGGTYDPSTREFIGTVRLRPEPDGSYSLPENVVEHVPPGPAPEHRTYVLNDAGDAWELRPDYRRILLWDTSTGLPVANRQALGQSLPDALTICAPLPIPAGERKRNVWDDSAKAWRLEDVPGSKPVTPPATTEIPPED